LNSLFWRGLVLIGLSALLVGCGSSFALKIYELGDPAPPAFGVWTENGLPIVELKIVTVPDYLDSSDILRRSGQNEVIASPAGRWGERLSLGLTHSLAAALSARLPTTVITTAFTSAPRRQIFVDIEKFDIEPDGRCLIAARWQIMTSDGQIALHEHGTFGTTATATDDPAIAVAMTQAVDQLAAEIARGIDRE